MGNPKRIFISTGEVSGDLQGSLLIQALNQLAQERGMPLAIDALGGDRMAAAGANLLANTSELGAIGLFEALPYVGATLKIQRRVRQYLKQKPPDLSLLIDYVGANLPLAGYLKQQGLGPVIYYIAPHEWVWALGQGTTRKLVERIDHILAIFPGEADYYRQHGARVTWVGHPFLDTLAAVPDRATARQRLGVSPDQLLIALLPASRQQELRHILPAIAAAARLIQTELPAAQFCLPIALPSFRQPLLDAIADYGLTATPTDQPQLALAAADLAIGKSGTANLEAALLNVPQVVVYRVHPWSGWLYKTILQFKVPYISPVNLVQQQAVVPELLQQAATPQAIAAQALNLLQHPEAREAMLNQYQALRDTLGQPGVIRQAAQLILNHLAGRSLA